MSYALILALFLSVEPGHDKNPVFKAVVDEGLTVGGTSAKLPGPTFHDGQTADEQHAALREIAGSARAAEEMLQPSISAPHRLKLRDTKAERATLRSGDLFFVLRGVDLDAIRPEEAFRQVRSGPIEAANMRFEARVLTPDELQGTPAATPREGEWFTHATGRLLDRIAVESTDRVVASRSADSLVFAAKSDPRFGPDAKFPNRWSTIEPKATGDAFGPAQPFVGGIGYVKMTRLAGSEKAVVVEVHFAFAEPFDWFQGEPVLRSKFGLIAQDQIRRLRRELKK